MTLQDDSLMPFGKYSGEPMQNLSAGYLDWLHGWLADQNSLWGHQRAVLDYIERNRDIIDKELAEQGAI